MYSRLAKPNPWGQSLGDSRGGGDQMGDDRGLSGDHREERICPEGSGAWKTNREVGHIGVGAGEGIEGSRQRRLDLGRLLFISLNLYFSSCE